MGRSGRAQRTVNLPMLREAVGFLRIGPVVPQTGGRLGIASAARRGLTYRHLLIVGSAIFLLSNALLVSALTPPIGLLVLIGCVASLWIVVKATAGGDPGLLAARIAPRTLALCWGAGLALCVLGGEGHFFFANYDWLYRDAVLADLVRQPFPVTYQYHGAEYVLRAPLGMYLIPAAVGKLLGLAAAHLALLVQNATILALMLALLAAMAPQRRAVFCFVFVTFSGVEILGRLLQDAGTGSSWWPVHAHEHLGWWNPLFQYTNHLTQIFWVPNHSFPGWWLAALSILYVRREIGSAAIVVAPAFLLFWSPLTIVGALPIIGFLVLHRELRSLDVGNLVAPRMLAAYAAALCFLPVAAYLAADAETVPHLWLVAGDRFWSIYVVFVIVQIPQAAVVALSWRRLDADLRLLSMLAIGMLLLIPIYRLGANNDFSMRASILPLALLAFVFASIVAQLCWRDGVKPIAAVAVILSLGSFAPALEIQRALMMNAFAVSDCNLLTAWHQLAPDQWLANYFARDDRAPAWLLARSSTAAPARLEGRQCWSDHPYRALGLPTTEWQEPTRW
jgi:hypothetical protein